MSYDVYIQELKVAVEYQGEQHFHPVEYFGSQESFDRQKIRDNEKRILSEKHGIKLVYINFNENVTPELIKTRIES